MELRELNREMSRLLQYGLQRGLLEREDLPYAANRMLALLGAREFTPQAGGGDFALPQRAPGAHLRLGGGAWFAGPGHPGRQGPAGHGSDELSDAPAPPRW